MAVKKKKEYGHFNKMKILITGNPGCGKTTLIKDLISEYSKDKTLKISGLITPEIRKLNARVGFKLVDLRSREEEILAHKDLQLRNPVKHGNHIINIEKIKRILDEFNKRANDADIIFLDEIGPMELKSKAFELLIEQILFSNKLVIATLNRNYIDAYKKYGEVIYLTRENYDEVKAEITEKMNKQLKRTQIKKHLSGVMGD